MSSVGPTPIEGFFQPGGGLSRAHPSYEFRPQQVEMARAVWDAIGDEEILLVEAGTGVGKSLAYLYPFFLWTKATGKKVAISTETKTLQKQLVEKDIPFLSQKVGLPIRAELCLGAGNYLCLFRLGRSAQMELFPSKQSVRHFARIAQWQEETATGLALELDFVPHPAVWAAVRVETDFCLRQKCPFFSRCFYFQARRRQEQADILVMNHHLFFANLAVSGAVLPRFKAVVFDEAHSLEEVATEFLGVQFSNYRIPNLLSYVYSLRGVRGFIPAHVPDEKQLADWEKLIKGIHLANDEFFAGWERKESGDKVVIRLKKPPFAEDQLSAPLGELSHRLKKFKDVLTDEENREELEGYLNRCQQMARDLDAILNFRMEDGVYWYEQERSGRRLLQTLNLAPIEVGNYLRERLWSEFAPLVLTSATLSTQGSFDFLKKRLGLERCRESLLSSPFDYPGRVLLYTDSRIPDPGEEQDAYEERIIHEVEQIIRAVGGGAFVLFTSYRMTDKVHAALAPKLGEYECFKQGDKDRYRLLEEFRNKPGSVLFGTTSFWQGVDVPGESLKCVIIVKLPFSVPDDPVTEARIEFVRKKGGNAFMEYQLPQAIVMLRQGFGRLMRSKQDYGVVAILDPRLRTKHYGRAFLASLPGCRVVSQVEQLRQFVDKMRTSFTAKNAKDC